jgi:hypothetical protein
MAVSSGVVRTTSPRKLVWGTTTDAPAPASIDAGRLIDEHDRDVVLDRVSELAGPQTSPSFPSVRTRSPLHCGHARMSRSSWLMVI